MAKIVQRHQGYFAAYAGRTFDCPNTGDKIQLEGNEEAYEVSVSAGIGHQTDEYPAFRCPSCGKSHYIQNKDNDGNGRDPNTRLGTA